MNKKRLSKEELMMGIAELVSKRSTCSRLQVGSVITDSTMKEIISYGYNGNYSGGPNECDSDEIGNCGCIHSEINSLIKAKQRGEIIFITFAPCLMCAKAIINSGIKKVYYKKDYRNKSGLNLLKGIITKL